MCNTEKLVVIPAKSGESKIYADDDGMLSLSKGYVSPDGIGGPVFLYKIDNLPIDNYPPFMYEVINKYGDLFFSLNVYDDWVVKNKYQILKTNDSDFAERFLYELNELKDDIELYNSQKANEKDDEDISDDDLDDEDFEDEAVSEDDADLEEEFYEAVEKVVKTYEKSCDWILYSFCEKHGYDSDDIEKASECGSLYFISDMLVEMCDMYFDLKNDIHPDIFEEWIWYNEQRREEGKETFCYPCYCKKVDSGEIEPLEEDDFDEDETDVEFDDGEFFDDEDNFGDDEVDFSQNYERYVVRYRWFGEDGTWNYDSTTYMGKLDEDIIEDFIDPDEEMDGLQLLHIQKI